MHLPPSLNKGGKIRIVSPAGKIARENVTPSVEWLKEQGYSVSLGKHVFQEYNQFAGTDQQRVEDLQTAIDDRDTDIIICARGGYGTARIVEKLDFSSFKKRPKWIVGFSDITVLHNYLSNLDSPSIHGVMPRHFLKNNQPTESFNSLLSILKAQKSIYTFPHHKLNRNGKCKGKLTGGNLSIIYSLRGTHCDINTDGKILFLEDLSEYLYHIDRMMTNLKIGGKLAHLTGLVIGDFSKMKDSTTPFGKNAYEIIKEAVEEYDYPVCFNFPAGHTKRNLALTLGVEHKLVVSDSESTLKML